MPNYLLRVALWQIPTMVVDPSIGDGEREASLLALNAMNNLGYAERMRLLEAQVEDAAAYFLTQPPPAGRRAVDVFVAPEYLFTRGDSEHFVDHSTKDRVCTQLKRLSERFPSMIIVPGTVAWKKPALRSNVVAQFFKRDRGKRAQTRRDAVGTMIDTSNKTAFTTARQSGQQYYLAENTAFVYSGGKVLLKYHKRNDGGEVNSGDGANVFWVPGDREGTFDQAGLEFCLQICAEHGSRPPSPSDVQIVIAASHGLRSGNGNVHDGGYLLHCDAVLAPEVRRFTAGNFATVAADQSGTASPLRPTEIAERTSGALAYQPPTARRGETQADAVARRTAEISAQLGGRVRYYLLPYDN